MFYTEVSTGRTLPHGRLILWSWVRQKPNPTPRYIPIFEIQTRGCTLKPSKQKPNERSFFEIFFQKSRSTGWFFILTFFHECGVVLLFSSCTPALVQTIFYAAEMITLYFQVVFPRLGERFHRVMYCRALHP